MDRVGSEGYFFLSELKASCEARQAGSSPNHPILSPIDIRVNGIRIQTLTHTNNTKYTYTSVPSSLFTITSTFMKLRRVHVSTNIMMPFTV